MVLTLTEKVRKIPQIKDKIIKSIRQLPDEILEKLYSLDVINHKGKMQYDLWLANRYREYRSLSHSEKWFHFQIGSWEIRMETEN